MSFSCFKILNYSISNFTQRYIAYRYMSSEPFSTFKFDDLEIELVHRGQKLAKPSAETLLSGMQFSNHMLQSKWSKSKGWQRPVISPLKNLSVHPAAKVFHNAIEVFESMKAYKGIDHKIRLFRPSLNMERMNVSAKRSSLPTFSGAELIKCIAKLVSVDRDWLDETEFSSLYIRPALIGTEPTIGVGTSDEAMLFVLTGPANECSAKNLKPISVSVDPHFIKTCPGGVGYTMMGSNHAPTLKILQSVESQDHQQFLWLYGEDHLLKEIGTMNIFVFMINKDGVKELVTPPLDGTIIPGVTRSSLLTIAHNWKEFMVSERSMKMDEIITASHENKILEVFGTGSQSGIIPVEQISYASQLLKIPTMKSDKPLFGRLKDALSDVQYGKVSNDWNLDIDECI